MAFVDLLSWDLSMAQGFHEAVLTTVSNGTGKALRRHQRRAGGAGAGGVAVGLSGARGVLLKQGRRDLGESGLSESAHGSPLKLGKGGGSLLISSLIH